MTIIVAGIKRSGSTAQYNMIRLALNNAGIDYELRQDGNGVIDFRRNSLIKRHPYHKTLADLATHIFLTDRPDIGIYNSLWRFNQKEPVQNRIDRMRKDLDLWRGHEHLEQHYNLIKLNPRKCIGQIIEYLGIEADGAQVYKEFINLKPPKEGQDPETLMFHNHITCS